jgi:hypothetical protein
MPNNSLRSNNVIFAQSSEFVYSFLNDDFSAAQTIYNVDREKDR